MTNKDLEKINKKLERLEKPKYIGLYLLLVIGILLIAALKMQFPQTGFAVGEEQNRKPTFSEIPTIEMTTEYVLNLSQYAEDLDKEELTFLATNPPGIIVDVTREIVTLTPENGFKGTAVITFIATDFIDVTRSNEVQIIVK